MRFKKYFNRFLCLSLVIILTACSKNSTPVETATHPTTTTLPPETTVPPTTSITSYEISLGMTLSELREIMGSDGERIKDFDIPRFSWVLANGQILTVSLQPLDPEKYYEYKFPNNWGIFEFKLDDSPYFTEPSSIVITPAEVIPPTVPESCELSLGMTLREVNEIMGTDGEVVRWESTIRYTWKLADGKTLTLSFNRPPAEDAPRPLEYEDYVVRSFSVGGYPPDDGPYFTEPSTITVSPAQPETEE